MVNQNEDLLVKIAEKRKNNIKVITLCLIASIIYSLALTVLYANSNTNVVADKVQNKIPISDTSCQECICEDSIVTQDKSAYFKFSPNKLFGMYVSTMSDPDSCEIVFTSGNGREKQLNSDTPFLTSCDFYAGGYASGQYMWEDDFTFLYSNYNIPNTYYKVNLGLSPDVTFEEIKLDNIPQKYSIRVADSSLQRAIVFDSERSENVLIDLNSYDVILSANDLGVISGTAYYDDINKMFIITQGQDHSVYTIVAIDSENNIDSQTFTQEKVEAVGRGCSGSWIHSGYKQTYIMDFCSQNQTFKFKAFDDVNIIFGSDQYYYDIYSEKVSQ